MRMVLQAGIMEEMLDDTLEMDDDQEIEEEADAEVDKVLFDLTNGKLGQAGAVHDELPVCSCIVKSLGEVLTQSSRRFKIRWMMKRRRGQWSNIGSN